MSVDRAGLAWEPVLHTLLGSAMINGGFDWATLLNWAGLHTQRLSSLEDQAEASCGIPSQVLPSSRRPARFL